MQDLKRAIDSLLEHYGNQILFSNEWVTVYLRDGWYTYVSQPKGDGVSVLIFDPEAKKIIVRRENCPPHGGFIDTSLTGGIEDGDTPSETALKEVMEEAGMDCNEGDLIYLGWVYPTKVSDFKQHLFALNGTGREMSPPQGDGTRGEEGASVSWQPASKAFSINDPSVSAIIARLVEKGINLL